jgi:hypothetical protein
MLLVVEASTMKPTAIEARPSNHKCKGEGARRLTLQNGSHPIQDPWWKN